jgi:serine phosphatase RsbU (regulator of sigma subunit)
MVGSHIDITGRKDAEAALQDRESQLRVAQRIQEHLLPTQPPDVPGFDVAGASYPAEFAAGDYFDYIAMGDGTWGLAVGDVSSHGFGPALLMASTCARFRSLAETSIDIDEILARANSSLSKEIEDGQFVTAILTRLDPRSRMLTYANAGHPTGYVLDASGHVKARMESTGFPLAIMPEADFPQGDPIRVDPGDLVLLLTDGVLEVSGPDDELFGMDRVLELVRKHRDEPAKDILERLCQAARDFSQGEHLLDDVTAVIVKAEPVAEAAEHLPAREGSAMADAASS